MITNDKYTSWPAIYEDVAVSVEEKEVIIAPLTLQVKLCNVM